MLSTLTLAACRDSNGDASAPEPTVAATAPVETGAANQGAKADVPPATAGNVKPLNIGNSAEIKSGYTAQISPRSSTQRPQQPVSHRDSNQTMSPPSNGTTIGEKQDTFGHSTNGRPLIAYVLGDGPNTTLIFGGFHGNEPATPGVVERLKNYLEGRPQEWSRCRVILVPRTNPDGLEAGTRVNARRVDINRNFPGTWKPQVAADRYNPGPEPGSEIETQAVMGLIRTYHPSKVISIHSPLHCMNYTGERGRSLAVAMAPYNHYSITPDIGYATPGSFGDYCGKTLGIGIVTLELPDISAAAGWEQNQKAFLAAINLM